MLHLYKNTWVVYQFKPPEAFFFSSPRTSLCVNIPFLFRSQALMFLHLSVRNQHTQCFPHTWDSPCFRIWKPKREKNPRKNCRFFPETEVQCMCGSLIFYYHCVSSQHQCRRSIVAAEASSLSDGHGGHRQGRGRRSLDDYDESEPEELTRVFVALFDYDPMSMSPNPDAADEELPFKEGQIIKVEESFLAVTFHFPFSISPECCGH